MEVLTPDFRGKGRMERALEILATNPPDVFNHNLETVRELYPNVRPGADYDWSLQLLQRFGAEHPGVPTKSAQTASRVPLVAATPNTTLNKSSVVHL